MEVEKKDGPLDLEELQKMDFWLVRRDENMEHWMLPPEFVEYVDKIQCVYLVDKSVGHHLCSLEAFWWLEPIHWTWTEKQEMPDELREKFDEWLIECDLEDIYIPIRSQFAEGACKKVELDLPNCKGETERQIRESLLDHYRGNPVW